MDEAPRPKKQVRFKTPSATSDTDETPEVKLIQLSQPLTKTATYVSLYDSSDTDCSEIPNAQECKYTQERVDTDDVNDEGTSTSTATPSPIEKITGTETDETCDSQDLQPTPTLPEELDQPDTAIAGEPLTSTPKESTTGVYSLIGKQANLSSL